MIRMLSATLVATFAMAMAPLAAHAETWPHGPITIVVPLAPGDGGDTTARALAQELSQELHQSVIVSNKPGAGGAVGVQSVIGAKNDGSTLLFTQNSPLTIRRVLEPQTAAYDPLRELVPLAITTRTPSVLVVRKAAPFGTFQELVAYAKAHPGKVRIGNAGSGSAGDLSVQVINADAGTDMLSVPYKGAAPAITDALGGQIDGVIVALGAVSGQIKAGGFKALALSNPFPELPQVPTLGKLGYKQDLLGVWFAWLAPAGTPPEVTQVLLPALKKAAQDPKIAARLQPMGIVEDWVPGAKLASEITVEYDTVSELAHKLQAKKP